jgi:DNA polymerase-4
MPLSYPSQSPYEIACAGYELFRMQYHWEKPIRALTIRGINPDSASAPIQLDLFNDYAPRAKQKALADAVDGIRSRFGERAIFNACLMKDIGMANDRCETVPMPSPMYQ